MMLTRRFVLTRGMAGLAAAAGSSCWATASDAAGTFELALSEGEWHERLTPDQYAVLRQSATEQPFTSPLLHEERRGDFACAGCDLDLFSSTTKLDSGTGWPSFWTPIENAVAPPRIHRTVYAFTFG
jgi:peptide-methionine (R)-S-oxide reductase